MDSDEVDSEHILLGLAREGEGVAARILLDFEADDETIRNEVIRTVEHGPVPMPTEKPAGTMVQIRGVPRPGRAFAISGRRADWLSMATGAALLGLGILVGQLIWG